MYIHVHKLQPPKQILVESQECDPVTVKTVKRNRLNLIGFPVVFSR